MKYQIIANILFDNQADALAAFSYIQSAKNKIYKHNGNEHIDSKSSCELWDCYHDEVPPQQCNMVDSIDFEV